MSVLTVPVAEQGDLLSQLAEGHPFWTAEAEPYLLRAARSGVPFQAADLAAMGCPEPYDHHWWGPLLQRAARRGLIEAHGVARSSRPETRHSLVRTWIGCNST